MVKVQALINCFQAWLIWVYHSVCYFESPTYIYIHKYWAMEGLISIMRKTCSIFLRHWTEMPLCLFLYGNNKWVTFTVVCGFTAFLHTEIFLQLQKMQLYVRTISACSGHFKHRKQITWSGRNHNIFIVRTGDCKWGHRSCVCVGGGGGVSGLRSLLLHLSRSARKFHLIRQGLIAPIKLWHSQALCRFYTGLSECAAQTCRPATHTHTHTYTHNYSAPAERFYVKRFGFSTSTSRVNADTHKNHPFGFFNSWITQ